MTVKLSQAKDLLKAQKSLLLAPNGHAVQWQAGADRSGKTSICKFECRVRTAATLPRGLWVRMQVSQSYPSIATIQLDTDFPNVRAHLPLYRLDLQPHGSHVNRNEGPTALAALFIDAGVSHDHSYSLYDDEPDLDLKADQSPVAKPLVDQSMDFEQALTYVCSTLNIDNRKDIPIVPLQGLLGVK
ncbi:MAG: hypothetical protein KGO94_02375 [Alphaproteobacteria bacterium]|nr:hypothetical protein [Alphaproteobacteria bacterium]